MSKIKNSTREGWAIVSINHPRTNSSYIVPYSFRERKREAIRDFIEGSGNSWKYWKKHFNFRAVRATETIAIELGESE